MLANSALVVTRCDGIGLSVLGFVLQSHESSETSLDSESAFTSITENLKFTTDASRGKTYTAHKKIPCKHLMYGNILQADCR